MPTIFKGRVFSVEVDRRRFPNGSEHEVEIVRHSPLNREIWEFPAGRLNDGESAEDAARRECEEEIGRAPQRVERIRGLYPAPGFCDEELIFFRVSDLRQPAPDSMRKADEDEDIQSRSMTVADVKLMIARGEIVDLKTAYAVTLI
jgi:ADP-ribose pyrophosphatase